MNAKIGLSICIVCLVAAGYLVPTTASSVGGGTEFVDGFDGDVAGDRDVIFRDDTDDGRALYATPAAGPNGEFASIVGEDGAERLELDFAATAAGGEGINPAARSTFDDVFVLVNEFEEPTAVRIEIVDAPGSAMDIDTIRDAVTFYTSADGGTELGGSDPVEIAPESTTSVGLEFDPVGRDLAGTSIEFAFVFTISDGGAGPESTDRSTTGSMTGDRAPTGPGTDESIGTGGNTGLFDEPGADAEGVGNEAGTPTDRSTAGPGTPAVTATPESSDEYGGAGTGVRSSLPALLIAVVLLVPVIVIGRRRW